MLNDLIEKNKEYEEKVENIEYYKDDVDIIMNSKKVKQNESKHKWRRWVSFRRNKWS